MSLRAAAVLTGALLILAPTAGQAALSTYVQDFEGLVQSDPAALSADGWVVYGNVFTPEMVFMYGYGPYPAPNPGAGFCAVANGQGGAEQGAQQLSVYSDYNNVDHANGNWVESNVYREWTIGAGDVGTLWVFTFDAKLGNLEGSSTALAFIKTLDSNNGYVTTNFINLNTTAIPTTWANYSLTIYVDASLVGQLLQIGFANTATHYEGSGVFYDNIVFARPVPTGVPGSPVAGVLELRGPAPNPFAGATRVEYATPRAGTADVSVYDVAGRHVATLFAGHVEAGTHAITWNGRCADGRSAPAGVYHCVLTTPDGVRTRNVVLTR